jgi:hypothetical protein
MNIALILQQRLFTALSAIPSYVVALFSHTENGIKESRTTTVFAPVFVANNADPVRAGVKNSCASTTKPLRVVRVIEKGQSLSSVGRMVISGRMADVCAELDRLAACEAALT